MKKLLVTLIGAAALGAFADTGVWFEDSAFTVGSTQTVAQINTIVGDYMSELPDSTNVYKVAAMGSQAGLSGYPVADNFVSDPTKALDVNTTFGKPLSVTNKVAATIGDGVYFDSLVKFTVCEDPMTTEYDGAKIVMWLQEESENDVITGTNLYVKAGFLTTVAGLTGVSNAVYKCEYDIGGDFADKWHRVTIKAIDDITKDGSEIPGFVIFIDGTGAAPNTVRAAKTLASVKKWDSTRTPALNESASFFNADGALFPSMVQSGPAKRSISTASFDGTGAVNMLLFTTTAPTFADDYRAPKGGYKIGTAESVDFYDLAELESAINGYSQESGEPVAITVTFTKGFEFDTPIEFVENEDVSSIVIDFNGCVITNTSDYCAITNSAMSLVFKDTIGTGGIRCTSEAEDTGAFWQTGTGAFTIEGGNFWGALKLEDATEGSVSGGSFQDDDTVFETEESETGTWIVPGKALVVDGVVNAYKIVDAYTITFISGEGSMTNAYSVAAGATVDVPAPAEVSGKTFDAWSPAIVGETVTASADATYTALYTVNNYTVKFISGEGSTTNEYTESAGTVLNVPTPVAVEGKSFNAWNPAIAGATVTVEANATYTALYTNNIYTITFVVGETSSSVQKAYGSTIDSIPETPVQPGYTGSWDDDPTGDTVTGDKTYTYTYSPVTYTITYKNADGTAFNAWADNYAAPASFTVVTVVTLPTSSDVELGTVGSTFNGWTNNVGTAVTTTEGLTANFEVFADVTAGGTNPTIIDPSNPAASTATVSAGSEEAAIQAVTVAAPTGSGATDADYKALFDYTATDNGNGTFDVAISDIKESVKEAVATTAEAIVSGTAETGTVTVPAGLYYKVTTYTALGTSGTVIIEPVLSTGAASSAITKPGTTQGFIKVEIATTAAELAD